MKTAVILDLVEYNRPTDIRRPPTANFLEKIRLSNDNSICMVFKRHALIGINRIYSTYGNIHSVPELKHVIDELFTDSC